MLQKAYTEWGLADDDDDCLADSQTSCWTTPQPRMNWDQAESRVVRLPLAVCSLLWLPLGLSLFAFFHISIEMHSSTIKNQAKWCVPLPWQVFAECLLFSLASILFLLLLLFKMKRYKWTSCCCCCCRVSSSVAASLEAAHGPVNILSVHPVLFSRVVLCLVALGQTSVGFLCVRSSCYSRTFSIKHRLAGQYFGFCFLYVFCLLGHAYGHPLFFRPILRRVHNLSFTELLSCTMGRNIIKSWQLREFIKRVWRRMVMMLMMMKASVTWNKAVWG